LALPTETDPSPPPALPILAAGTTLLLGGLATLMGGAHLDGVLVTAGRRHYAYDFRFAGLLLLGFTITFAGILCLTAVRGLAHARRPAWDRALIGTLLFILVTAPVIPMQPEMAPGLVILGLVNVVALLVSWRSIEAA
jgi:hypothetical protein